VGKVYITVRTAGVAVNFYALQEINVKLKGVNVIVMPLKVAFATTVIPETYPAAVRSSP
jgi:hypothetical protein